MANQRGYVHLAIIEWETAHENQFPEGMEPHHLNGVKTDDRPENILPVTHAEHTAISTWKRRGNSKKASELEARLILERNS